MPLLPAEQQWLQLLEAAPSAGAAMDRDRVYIPLRPETLVALRRDTGATAWTRNLESAWAPIAVAGSVYVAASDELHALDAASGDLRWRVPIDRPMQAPLTWAEGRIMTVIEPGEVIAFQPEDGHVAWRHALGAASRHPVAADGTRVFISLVDGRVVALDAATGLSLWERRLPGILAAPSTDGARVFIGSDDNHLYTLDATTGRLDWKWRVGGDVIGAAADADGGLYFASLDNLLRGVSRSSGNQRWKKDLDSRAALPPLVVGNVVVVAGVGKVITAYAGKTGQVVGNFTGPAEFEGAPLIDDTPRPFAVSIVLITRDGRAIGLRPTGMLFKESAVAPLTGLPGTVLPRETAPALAQP